MEYIKSPNKVIQPISTKEYDDYKAMIALIRRVEALEERLGALDTLNKDKGVIHGN